MQLSSTHRWLHVRTTNDLMAARLPAKPCCKFSASLIHVSPLWRPRLVVACGSETGSGPHQQDTNDRGPSISDGHDGGHDNSQDDGYTHVRPIAEGDTGFGPRGILLAGFSQADAEAASAWMEEMEPGFRVNHATDDMMGEVLAEALYDPDTQEMRTEEWQQTTTLMPRICIMSGLSGAEQIAIAEAWADYGGSAAPFFAAAVPNSLDQPIRDVLQAVVDENAKHAEDDPRLQPANVMANVDSEGLKAVIAKKMERNMRKKEERQAKKEAKQPSSPAKGFG